MNRRKFLGGATLAGAALAVPGAVKALTKPTPKGLFVDKYTWIANRSPGYYAGLDWTLQSGDIYTIEGVKNLDGKLTRFIVPA